MKVYNEDKTKELQEYDLTKGHLESDVLTTHHEGVVGVEEQGHYETIAKYPNGGKDVAWIVDIPGVKSVEPYDTYEDILIYVPYTEQELVKQRISELKQKLAETDYQAIKFAEGAMTAAEYAPYKADRAKWRAEINELEKKL